MNVVSTDNFFATSQTKAQKLKELCELLNELYALKEKEGVRKGD